MDRISIMREIRRPASAALKGVLALVDSGASVPVSAVAYAWAFAASLLGSFDTRMLAVFMLSVTTMGAGPGTVTRWLAIPGRRSPHCCS